MGILLGILELIKVGIIYSFIFLFNNGISLVFTILSFLYILGLLLDKINGPVSAVFFPLALACGFGLIFHLATKNETR